MYSIWVILQWLFKIIYIRHIKLIKIKAFIMLQKISILNKCCSSEILIHLWIQKKINASQFPQKYCAAQLFSTLIIIINVSWAANQHIRMISDDHVTLKTGVMMLKIQLFNIYSHRKKVILNYNNISQYCCFYCIFHWKMQPWWAEETSFNKKTVLNSF